MQTFLPLEDFLETAQVLDTKRLGKQRVECLQIVNALFKGGGWRNHPAVRMWRPYPVHLGQYSIAICHEWKLRGYADTCRDKIAAQLRAVFGPTWIKKWEPYPIFLGHEPFHASHRAALLLKDPKHYSQFRWAEKPRIEYIWPTHVWKNHFREPVIRLHRGA